MIRTARNRNTLWSCGVLLSLGIACADHADNSPAGGEPATEDPGDPDDPGNTDPGNTDPSGPNTPKSTDPGNTDPGNTDPNNPNPSGVWGTTPALRANVTLSDSDLASQALSQLQTTCSGCHTLGRPTLTRWAQLTQEFATDCLGNTDLPDQAAVNAMLACFEQRAGSAKSPEQFGIYAAASRLPWFSFLFQHSAGGASAQGAFESDVGMPLAGTPLTQAQFDIVAHIDNTRALEPLERSAGWEQGEEPPETYPFAV